MLSSAKDLTLPYKASTQLLRCNFLSYEHNPLLSNNHYTRSTSYACQTKTHSYNMYIRNIWLSYCFVAPILASPLFIPGLNTTSSAGECTPGTFSCDNKNHTIQVCGPSSAWVISAHCGDPGCCRSSDDGRRAHCYC